MPTEPTAASTRNLRLQTPLLSLRSAQRKAEAPEDSNPENLTLQLTLHAPPHSNTPSVPKKTLKRIKIKIKMTLPPWCSFEPSRFMPPLFSPRSALGPTLVHSVQTRAKESLYRRHLLLVSHVCLSGHSIPLWKTKRWSVRLWYGKIVYLTWVFFLQGIILTATVFPPWLPGPWSLCEYSYLTCLQPFSPTGI